MKEKKHVKKKKLINTILVTNSNDLFALGNLRSTEKEKKI